MNPPIYAAVTRDLGFCPDVLGPTPSASDLIVRSYGAVRKHHARHRRRDEKGRFLPEAQPGVVPLTDVVPGIVLNSVEELA